MSSKSFALVLITLTLLTTGCSNGTGRPDGQQTASSGGANGITAEAMAQWSRSCALCHVRGEGGAPTVGDTSAWSPRLAQGEDVLLQHTLDGLNNMPPLGYCMDCEEDDFRQIIRFMAGDAGGES